MFKDGQYQVALPWKESHDALPDNYHFSKKRLFSLLHRLKQKISILKEYDTIIRDQLSQGIVEVVDDGECQSVSVSNYIPHFAVIRQDKETSKLRIVYDALARADGPSLNDCLCTGLKFGQNIMDIVLQFRVHNIALAADIEKAFLMISVSETDRDVLRFLWVDDVTRGGAQIYPLSTSHMWYSVYLQATPLKCNSTASHPEVFFQLPRGSGKDHLLNICM